MIFDLNGFVGLIGGKFVGELGVHALVVEFKDLLSAESGERLSKKCF